MARKAGNVHPGRAFDDLTHHDFLTSAAAIVPALDAHGHEDTPRAVKDEAELVVLIEVGAELVDDCETAVVTGSVVVPDEEILTKLEDTIVLDDELVLPEEVVAEFDDVKEEEMDAVDVAAPESCMFVNTKSLKTGLRTAAFCDTRFRPGSQLTDV